MLTHATPIFNFHYKANKVPGAHRSADDQFPYSLYHEDSSRFSWEFTFFVNGEFWTFTWPHVKWPNNQLGNGLDQENLNYRGPEVALDDVEEWVAHSKSGLNGRLTIKGQHTGPFFKILQRLSNDDSDETNFAAPDPSKIGRGKLTKIEESVIKEIYEDTSSKAKPLTHKFEYKDFPCEIQIHLDKIDDLVMKDGALVTETKAVLLFDVGVKVLEGALKDTHDTPNDRVARLIALDWESLQNNKDSDVEVMVNTWKYNIMKFYTNYTNIRRGKQILTDMIKRATEHATVNPDLTSISDFVRNEVDARLITANAWDHVREKASTEKYQHILQKRIGNITEVFPWAAPLGILRYMRKTVNKEKILFKPIDTVAWVLQSGLAHCSEHAFVSFFVLTGIHYSSPSIKNILPILYCTQTTVDHALVVFGVRPYRSEERKLKPGNVHAKGETQKLVNVFDLSETLKHRASKGGVCDPYLEKRFPVASDLAKAISRGGKSNLILREHYPLNMGPEVTIPFNKEHPSKPI